MGQIRVLMTRAEANGREAKSKNNTDCDWEYQHCNDQRLPQACSRHSKRDLSKRHPGAKENPSREAHVHVGVWEQI